MIDAGESRAKALEDAALAEGREALALAECLGRARAAAQRLDAAGLEGALGEARGRADGLGRAGARLARQLGEAARSLGLDTQATLGDVALALGPSGARVTRAAAETGQALWNLSREAGALGLAARYGAGVTGHLLGLARAAGSYGPGGRVTATAPVPGRRA